MVYQCFSSIVPGLYGLLCMKGSALYEKIPV